MYYKIKVGNSYNVPVADYYAESDKELENFQNVLPGSVAIVLTKEGLKTKMYHSSEGWIEI